MNARAFLVHALSPLHAGTGHSADIIDLPIARMKATQIPFVPGSSLKGVLRDARADQSKDRVRAVFGPDDDPGKHAGALVVGDARLLAMPVRSFRGTFAWVTSPLLLSLAARDLGAGAPAIPVLPSGVRVARSSGEGSVCVANQRVYLEELDLEVADSPHVSAWAQWLAPHVSPSTDIFSKRFLVVDDDTMSYFWETATQVDARVRLDETTRTVANGALWLEESLPPESLLIGLMMADRSRRDGVVMKPQEILDFALGSEETVQVGGKASVGRGRCRVVPLPGGN